MVLGSRGLAGEQRGLGRDAVSGAAPRYDLGPPTPGLTLDTGALLALERGDPRVRALLLQAVQNRLPLAAPAGVIAQAWRGGARQARVARLLDDPAVQLPPLEKVTARAVGVLCRQVGHADIVDIHVALYARSRGHVVVTSDPEDLRRIVPDLHLIIV